MIPYDDLVVALSAWRARQGLPGALAAGAAPPPPRAPAAPPPAARSAPPAPPRPTRQVAPERQDFDEVALVEDSPFDAGEDDYVVALGVEPGEPTAIGAAPEPVTEGLLVPKRGKRNP